MDITIAVPALGALAQETRLKIFRFLVQAGPDGLAVGKIAECLGARADGRLTFHLKALVLAGLVTSRQAGRFMYYSANYPMMNNLLAYLTEHCCAGIPCGEAMTSCTSGSPPPSADHA